MNKDNVGYSNKFQNYLKQKFSLEKLSKKLQKWNELEFGDRLKEFNKAIKTYNKERSNASLKQVPLLTEKR
jgi:hypothetical protein